MEIKYKITFLDFWHCGSGLSGGAKCDNTCIKDAEGFPYIPGKTIKGVLRDIADDNDLKIKCFGDRFHKSPLHFSNAELDYLTKNRIKDCKLTHFLFSTIAQTAINENGTAKDGSLRNIEVVKPISLNASIDNVNNDCLSYLQEILKSLRQMGLNRTRGLGRLKIDIL